MTRARIPDSPPLSEGISAVVPVYNSVRSLFLLHERLTAVIASLGRPDYEILFVDDGGRDASWEAVTAIAAKDPHVRGIRLSRNFGQHNALLCGLRAARFDWTATLDDDLQHPPEELPKLVERLNQGYDAVYGTPEIENHGLFRNLASRVTKLALQKSMDADTAAMVSAFRLFRTELRSAFAGFVGPFVSLDVLLTWGTAKFSALRVRHEKREFEHSQYSLRKLFSHAMNMMTGFSVLPLQLASFIGFSCAFFGLGVFIFVVGRKLFFGTPVPGFPFLASTIAIFSGAQMLSLGIIGEYLARMHFRVMDKPAYNIRSTTPPPT